MISFICYYLVEISYYLSVCLNILSIMNELIMISFSLYSTLCTNIWCYWLFLSKPSSGIYDMKVMEFFWKKFWILYYFGSPWSISGEDYLPCEAWKSCRILLFLTIRLALFHKLFTLLFLNVAYRMFLAQ